MIRRNFSKRITGWLTAGLLTTMQGLPALAQSDASFIDFTTYGYRPGSGEDVMPLLNKALNECRTRGCTRLTLPKGRYDVYSTDNPDECIQFYRLNHFTFDGQGSEFVFHGESRMFVVSCCNDITLCNFTADWERPATTQATVIESSDNYLDVYIDHEQYPYTIEDGKIYFISPTWKKPAASFNLNIYDGQTGDIVYQTKDTSLGTIFEHQATSMGNDVIRFYGKTEYRPKRGMIVGIHTQFYPWAAITIEESKDVLLNNIRTYHSFGGGLLASHSENITMDNAFAAVNEAKGRVFSVVGDNAHFSNCRGMIRMVNCTPTGMGDDGVNVHGHYFEILDLPDRHTLQLKVTATSIADGEEIWLVDHEQLQRMALYTVEKATHDPHNGQYTPYTLTFSQELPRSLHKGDYVESKTWTPNVEISHCRFGKKNRARGILVTTPGQVVIENNEFNTAGAAILIEGDTDRYFESGACNEVIIRDNVFVDCLTSGSNRQNGEWGDAVISLTPSYHPSSASSPTYHQNVRIENNTFNVFDAPIVRARSVGSLSFTNNSISQTYHFKPFLWQTTAFHLDGCRHVQIANNSWDSSYTSRHIHILNMRRRDVNATAPLSISTED